MNLTLEERMRWDEIYSKVFDEIRNSEYVDIMAANPEQEKDIALEFANAYAKGAACEIANKAIMDLTQS